MAGYNRPIGGWNYVFDGLNTLDAPDAIQPTQYPYARNIRGLADRKVRARPGYTLFSTSPSILTACPITPGLEDTAYSTTFTAVGGISPYTWAIIAGALPAGLTLSSGGVLSGTPTEAGSFSFTVQVTDSAGGTDSVACSIYICAVSLDADWIGCLAGSFTDPTDWVSAVGGIVITGGQAVVTGLGIVANTLGGCGTSLNQEVYMVYNTKVPGVGNRGRTTIGPGCRVVITSPANYDGYFFVADIWGGNSGATCGYSGTTSLYVLKVAAGVISQIGASVAIAGPDLTPGIPFSMTCTVEGAGARIIGYLGGIQILSVLDSTAVLPAGSPGIGALFLCGGTDPDVYYSFFKARNL